MSKYFRDKRLIYLSAGFVILLAIVTGMVTTLSALNMELDRLKLQHKEMLLLRDEFLSMRNQIDKIERKKTLTKVNGIIPAVDSIFSSIGLRDNIKSIKPVSSREMYGDVEEEAEVSVEKISMNEMANLFYKIENAPMLLVFKKADIKKSFEKPDRMNLIMTLSLVHGK